MYEIHEAQFEYNDYFKEQGYNNGKEYLDEWAEKIVEAYYDETDGRDFEYKIVYSERLSKSELEDAVELFDNRYYVDKIGFEYEVEDGYLVGVSLKYHEEEEIESDHYVLKVNDKWCALIDID